MCKYHVNAKYQNKTQGEASYTVKKELKIYYPNYSAVQDANTQSMLEFRLPLAKNSKTLDLCKEGLFLRTDPSTKNLFALRKCVIHIYFRSHTTYPQFIKMNSDKEVIVFSYESLVKQLQSDEEDSGISENDTSSAVFVFGKDPNKTPLENCPVIVIVKSNAVEQILDSLPRNKNSLDSGEILRSKSM